MKRKLSLIGAAIMVLLIAYSGVAWWMLRGAGAYRMGTQLGRVLSASWQYTALAALLLVLVLGIPFMFRRIRKSKVARPYDTQKNLHSKGEKSGTKTEIQTTTKIQQDTEKIQPRRGVHTSREDKTVLLHDGATVGDETVLLSDSTANSGNETVLLSDSTANSGDETVLLSDSTANCSDETVPLRDGVASHSDETALLTGDDSIYDDTTPLLREELSTTENDTVLPQAGSIGSEKTQTNNALPVDNPCCPKCGAPTRVGQKFCTRCGCVLRGGDV